jgi:hypothetical protein
MPMIDVYAAAGTFSEKHKLAQDLANAVMRWEKVPSIDLFVAAAGIRPWRTERGYLSRNRLRADGESTVTRIRVRTSSQPHAQN